MGEAGKLQSFFEQSLSPVQREQFAAYYDLLVEWNQRMNLTAIVEKEEVYGKHFIDSLVVNDLPEWQHCVSLGGRVADVGTGAGLPGLALAICYPQVQFTLCDALQKRVTFLQHVVQELRLENVELRHGRAEELAREQQLRNQFDVVVARAVARLNVLLEWTTPFVKVSGHVLAYKGPSVVEELAAARRAAKLLRAEVARTDLKELPEAMGSRSLVVIRQMGLTPAVYPRKPGTASRSPLGESSGSP